MILFLGHGFIATALSNLLASAGLEHRIVSTDVADDQPFRVRADISSLSAESPVFEGVETVIYFAHSSVPFSSMQNVLKDARENILIAIALLEIFAKRKIRLIYISSGGSVYGNQEGVTTEDALPVPISAYGASKYAIENYIKLFHHNEGLQFDILRFSNVYGVGQHLNKPQGLTGALARSFIAKEAFQIWGDGTAKKDYIYIDDAAEALTKVLNSPASNDTFNVSFGESTSILEIVSMFEDIFGYPIEIKKNEPFRFDAQNVFLSNEKFAAAHNWKPTIDMKTGVRRTVDWILATARSKKQTLGT